MIRGHVQDTMQALHIRDWNHMRSSRGCEWGDRDVNVNGRKGSGVAESKIVFVKLRFYWSPGYI